MLSCKCIYNVVLFLLMCIVCKKKKELVECVRRVVPDMLQKVKAHLLLHLPDKLIDFAPHAIYNTESYLTCNAQHRFCKLHSYMCNVYV